MRLAAPFLIFGPWRRAALRAHVEKSCDARVPGPHSPREKMTKGTLTLGPLLRFLAQARTTGFGPDTAFGQCVSGRACSIHSAPNSSWLMAEPSNCGS